MPKQDLGTKRECPETGKRFYDLNKDPITSPYTGKVYPLSFFEAALGRTPKIPEDDKPSNDPDTDTEDDDIEDATEKGDDEDEDDEGVPEVVEVTEDAPIPTSDDSDDDDEGGVPEGFSEDSLGSDDDDVLLDEDDNEFDIDADTDVDLDDDLLNPDDEEEQKN